MRASFIYSLCTTIRPKIRILINLFFLFVHGHSTKVRGSLLLLIYSFLNCSNILFAVLPLCFVRYNHTLIFHTLYSLKSCSYILYTISIAIWSLSPLNRNMVWSMVTFTKQFFYNLKQFWGKCTSPATSVYWTIKNERI